MVRKESMGTAFEIIILPAIGCHRLLRKGVLEQAMAGCGRQAQQAMAAYGRLAVEGCDAEGASGWFESSTRQVAHKHGRFWMKEPSGLTSGKRAEASGSARVEA